jgi:hypothetical protein
MYGVPFCVFCARHGGALVVSGKDFIRVMDLAAGHVAAVKLVLQNEKLGCKPVNLGRHRLPAYGIHAQCCGLLFLVLL